MTLEEAKKRINEEYTSVSSAYYLSRSAYDEGGMAALDYAEQIIDQIDVWHKPKGKIIPTINTPLLVQKSKNDAAIQVAPTSYGDCKRIAELYYWMYLPELPTD